MPKKAKQIIKPIATTADTLTSVVFSGQRTIQTPPLAVPKELEPNKRLKMDGLEFLSKLPAASIPVAFFDPQYRGVLDKLQYGNEGKTRGKRRSELMQMTEEKIAEFIAAIDRVLIASGHLFLWTDKFHLMQGTREWFDPTSLDVVDLITWNKGKIGMGYRTRRTGEYCIVLQKEPRQAKGVWKVHNIPDVCHEPVLKAEHPHTKPVDLQGDLIMAVSNEGDYVIDPAAGSFSVLQAAQNRHRNFLGCDLEG